MAVYKLTTLQPSNPVTPMTGTRLIITRRRANDLLKILNDNYPRESTHVKSAIEYELSHSFHESHIAFIVDDEDIDGITAIQCASMDLLFNYKDAYRRDVNEDGTVKECKRGRPSDNNQK